MNINKEKRCIIIIGLKVTLNLLYKILIKTLQIKFKINKVVKGLANLDKDVDIRKQLVNFNIIRRRKIPFNSSLKFS